jgi:hypothetical protein
MSHALRHDEMKFIPDPGITGFAMAPILTSDDVLVKFWRIPAGWSVADVGVEENLHFHRRASEYAAVLDGDFPHIEYDCASDSLRRIRFGAGDLMIRPPGSLHGLHQEMSVLRDCTMLYWNTGPGTSLLDANYANETTDVSDDLPRWRPELNDRCRITRVDLARTAASTATGAPAGSSPARQVYSQPGEAFEVAVVPLRAGERRRVRDLAGTRPLLTFLWSGHCHSAASDATRTTDLPRWSLLLDGDGGIGEDDWITADEDACWLQVLRP